MRSKINAQHQKESYEQINQRNHHYITLKFNRF